MRIVITGFAGGANADPGCSTTTGSARRPAVLGMLAAVACVVLTLAGAAYWLYSTAVTVAVILLTSTRSGFLGEDAQRIVCTVVAAVVSVVALMVVERIGARSASRT